MPKILENKIVWDSEDWLSGLHPQYGTSTTEIQKGVGLASANAFNPYRYLGNACAGQLPTDVSGVAIVDALIKKGTVNNGNLYMVGAGAKLHKLTLATNTIVNDTAGTGFPHTITGTTPLGSDILKYYIGATEYLFYSYNNSTQGQIGRNDFSTTFLDTYLTAASPNGLGAAAMQIGVPHPMYVGSDDILYVADGRNLHALDGQTGAEGTWSTNVLTLPIGYVITSFAEVGDKLVIFAYNSTGTTGGNDYYLGESTAWFWNYLDLDPIDKINLDNNYVDGGFNFNGTCGCFVNGRKNDLSDIGSTKTNKVLLWDGSNFVSMASFAGRPVKNGSCYTEGSTIYFAAGIENGAVNIYSLQDKKLNLIAQSVGTTGGGMLNSFFQGIQYLSSGTTTGGGLKIFYTNFDECIVSTAFTEPLFPKGMKGKINNIKVTFGLVTPNATGLRIQFISDDDLFTPKDLIDPAVTTTVTSNDIVREYDVTYQGKGLGTFSSLKPVLQWTSTESPGANHPVIISKIEVEFETINI